MRLAAPRIISTLLILFLTAAYVVTLRDIYITHGYTITHDSIANVGPYQFAFTALRRGTLPLWSAEMNAGEPLWPIVELHPAYDPVPLAVFAIATQAGATGITAFSFVLLVWLVGFAIGGWLLAGRIGLSPVSRVLVFTILLWSSPGVLMLYQSQYLVIARWVPLILAVGLWFFERPTIPRAALFGIVVGIALPGYQTPYLALFALVLALSGGRESLALLRKIPRSGLAVAAFFTLTIMLPTLIAAAEWLGMVPVARLAWPRGTRAVLVSDVLAPLFGRLGTESALYVGIVPLLLALVAGAVGIAGRDRRARFWVRATVGTGLIFLGAPEMITGRDEPFLFVRDWTFVLPFVVLCLSMLAGIGLDWVRARLVPRRDPIVAIGLVVLAALDLFVFANTQYRRIAFPRTPELQAREPATVQPIPRLPALRNREFDIAAYAPFHKQGPAVWGIPSAHLDPEPFAPPYRPLIALGQIYTHGSHYFRLPRYHLAFDALPRPVFDCIAGATCPVVRLVGPGRAVPDFGAALAALSQSAIERLQDVVVVERGEATAGTVRTVDANETAGAASLGTVAVRAYRPALVEFDVEMRRVGLLYYADGYSPDWSATVDGRPAPVLVANGAFKAVDVPAGSHRVTLAYRPDRYVIAFAIRALAVFGGLMLVLLQAVRGTGPRSRETPE